MGIKSQNLSSRTAAKLRQKNFSSDASLLCETAKGRDHLIVQLIAVTGLTPSEIVNLQVRDIQKGSIHIRSEITRNNLSRTISISTQLVRKLFSHTQQKAPDEFVFSTRQSPKLTTRRIEQIFTTVSKAAMLSVPITPRDLRNSFVQYAAHHAKTDHELKNLTGLKTITKKDTLNQKQQERVLATAKAVSPRELALTQLILDTGISLSEALTLKKKNLARNSLLLPRGQLQVSEKTQQLLQILTSDKQLDENIFSTRQSAQISLRRAEQILQNIAVKAKLSDTTSHTLRATALQRIAAEQGVEVARLHAGLKSSLRYLYGHIDIKPGSGGAP